MPPSWIFHSGPLPQPKRTCHLAPMELSLEAPKSAGCLVHWDDIPRVLASLSVYGACLGFGAGLASLGASVPEMAGTIHTRDTNIGRMFVFRGLGFLGGALLSTRLVRMKIPLSKHAMCCVAVILAGASLALVPFLASTINDDTTNNTRSIIIYVICLLFLVEGMCFGGIDTYSALSISEMWGQRTQPWMQAKNLFSNFGCLMGPELVSHYGYGTAFVIIGVISCFSVVGIALMYVNNALRRWMGLPVQDNNVQCAELGVMELTIDAIEEHSNNGSGSPHIESSAWDALAFRVLGEIQQSQISAGTSPVKRSVYDFASVALSPQKKSHPPDFSLTNMEQQASSPVNPTLTYASPELARKVRRTRKPVGIVLVPIKVRLLLALFVFWELGLMCSFGGWVGTYVSSLPMDSSAVADAADVADISPSEVFADRFQRSSGAREGWHTMAMRPGVSDFDASASVLSSFYAMQIVSSVVSIPASVIFSTSTLLRCQLGLVMLAGVVLCLPVSLVGGHWLFYTVSTSAGMMGLALGCMYPLAMTIVNDYGATMTSDSTIAVVLGGCIGEATAPFLIALAIGRFGPSAFPASIVLVIVALVATYIVLHVYLKYTPAVQFRTNEEKVCRNSSPLHRANTPYSSPLNNPFSRTATPSEFNNSCKDNDSGDGRMTGDYSPVRGRLLHNEFTPLVLPARAERRLRPQSLYITSFGAHSNNSINSSINSSIRSSINSHAYEGLQDEAL